MNEDILKQYGIELDELSPWDNSTKAIAGILVLLMALAFVLSFGAQTDFAVAMGFGGWYAWIIPVIIDGGLIALAISAVVSELRQDEKLKDKAWTWTKRLVGVSALINFAHGLKDLTTLPSLAVDGLWISVLADNAIFYSVISAILFTLAPVMMAVLLDVLSEKVRVTVQDNEKKKWANVRQLTRALEEIVVKLGETVDKNRQLVDESSELVVKLDSTSKQLDLYQSRWQFLNEKYQTLIMLGRGEIVDSHDIIAERLGMSKAWVGKTIKNLNDYAN